MKLAIPHYGTLDGLD